MYMWYDSPICLQLERQDAPRTLSRACANTGNRIAARMAIIAITTSSSISVNPLPGTRLAIPLSFLAALPAERPGPNPAPPRVPIDAHLWAIHRAGILNEQVAIARLR